ncbi:hypothetical protein [Spirosoma endbachense]|uniref:Uncharacterized protein n=1 Tax=Spirosoma endbachense TaxID=2666025 RepID=A0A6P1VS45_9BACT|nr:hypothetical protein [Spirosoma endbachense]QHV94800.1 hypothetical protein GJR95_07120 [Spirosoma endbachense]
MKAKRKQHSPAFKAKVALEALTMNLLHRLKPKNMAAQLDNFADEFSSLIQFMQVEAVL